MSKNKTEKIEKIIRYIDENTKNGEPILLRSIDVSNIFKIPQSTCIRLLRNVKEDERIEARKTVPGKNKSTPYYYIYKNNIKSKKVQTKELQNIQIEKNENDPNYVLCNNLFQFAEHIDNFKNFITQTVDFIKNGESSEALKENLEQSKDIIEKFLKENSDLRAIIEKEKKENEDLKKYIRALKDCNDNVISFMQERLQIVIIEISNQSKEYVSTPKWQINSAFDSKFEKKIVDIITTAIDDIIENNTNIKVE